MTARAPSLHGGESRLLIGQAHGYGGTQAGDCLMLEGLSNLRFFVVPVPHDSGDPVADDDGHFGKDSKDSPVNGTFASVARRMSGS